MKLYKDIVQRDLYFCGIGMAHWIRILVKLELHCDLCWVVFRFQDVIHLLRCLSGFPMGWH